MAVVAKLHQPDPHRKSKGRRLRTVRTLPTICTLANLLCGFGAMHMCLRAMWLAGDASAPLEIITRDSQLMERLLPTHIVMAAYLVFLAMVFDALDGRLARLTRSPTEFGAQLDSLADIVSFGAAPALMVITMLTRQLHGQEPLVLSPFSPSMVGRLAWIMTAVYVACAALRLARFNVETQPEEAAHKYFKGLPSPGAAAALACLVILHDHVYFYDKLGAKSAFEQGGRLSETILWTLPVVALLLGLLMVSRFRYVHVVNRYLRGRRSFAGIVKALFLVAVLVAYPEVTMTVLVVGYALSGAILTLVHRFAGLRQSRHDAESPALDASRDASRSQAGESV